MEAKLESISPAIAKKYLKQNIDHNRPISRRWVEVIVDLMKKGEWADNGESIKFTRATKDHPEELLDGQHRLRAVIQFGKAVDLLVVRGLDRDAFQTIDAGKKRTAADCLSIAGYQQTTTLAAALRTLWLYRLDYSFQYSRKVVPTTEIFKLLEDHPAIQESVHLGHRGRFIVPGSTLVFFHYVVSSQHPDEATEFITKLTEGVSMVKGDPILTFRDRLFRYKAANVRIRKDFMIGMLFKTWNYWINGEHIEKLRYVAGEEFPRLIGVDRLALFGSGYDYPTEEELAAIEEKKSKKKKRGPYSQTQGLNQTRQKSLFTNPEKIPPVKKPPVVSEEISPADLPN